VTRVRIVDGQPLMRHELEGLLALSADVTVVGRAGDGEESLTVMAEHDPDVMLLDLRMPGRDGIETLEELTRLGADVAVLVLTTFDDDELVLRALRAGARGYLLKDVGLEELLDAIRTLAGGGTLVQPALTERVLRTVGDRPAPDGFAHLPTPACLRHARPRSSDCSPGASPTARSRGPCTWPR